MVARHFAHQGHYEHVVVDGKVALFVDRRQFKLVRCHLVMSCLYRDAEFESLDFKVFHECDDPCRNGSEIMVLQLLVLRCLMAHEGASGQEQVRAGGVKPFVDKEIFLFPAEECLYFVHFRIEVAAYIYGCLVNCPQCLQKRSLIVQGLSGIGDEDGRDAEGVVNDEYGR